MSAPSVYLAGPISGITYAEGASWRDAARVSLNDLGIDAYSPLRGKSYLASSGIITSGDYGHHHPLSSARGVMIRDFTDCIRRDLVLAYLVGAERVSIGTCMEIAWAYQARIPCIIVLEPGNPHEHIMVTEAGLAVQSLEVALEVVARMLLP